MGSAERALSGRLLEPLKATESALSASSFGKEYSGHAECCDEGLLRKHHMKPFMCVDLFNVCDRYDMYIFYLIMHGR